IAPVALFHILAERELDRGVRAFELHLLRARTPPELDELALTADRIRGPVEHVRFRHPAGKLEVDVHVIGVDEISDPHLGRDALPASIPPSVRRGMRGAVDDPRREVLPGAVDDDRAGWRLEALPNRRDPAALHEHVAWIDLPGGTGGPYRRVPEEDRSRL